MIYLFIFVYRILVQILNKDIYALATTCLCLVNCVPVYHIFYSHYLIPNKFVSLLCCLLFFLLLS